VAIAWSPATPAPITSTFAGGIVPAAVVSMGKKVSTSWAARSTAMYPAAVACEDRASIRCATVIRGTSSMLKLVTFAFASARTSSGEVKG